MMEIKKVTYVINLFESEELHYNIIVRENLKLHS